jgi:hypothetical protein
LMIRLIIAGSPSRCPVRVDEQAKGFPKYQESRKLDLSYG